VINFLFAMVLVVKPSSLLLNFVWHFDKRMDFICFREIQRIENAWPVAHGYYDENVRLYTLRIECFNHDMWWEQSLKPY